MDGWIVLDFFDSISLYLAKPCYLYCSLSSLIHSKQSSAGADHQPPSTGPVAQCGDVHEADQGWVGR